MKTVIRILNKRGVKVAAQLLRKSRFDINATDTYGSALFSRKSTAEIYSPIDANEKLLALPQKIIDEILKAFQTAFPTKDYSEEICWIQFFPDPELPDLFPIIEVKRIQSLDLDLINEQIQKCNEKISNDDFNGAITNARTLIEGICIFIIESNGAKIVEHGNLIKLYKQASSFLNMDPSKHAEVSLRQITQGCVSIVSGIASLRNKAGDVHGIEKDKIFKPKRRHAQFIVNIAFSISEFLVQSYEKKT